MGRHLAGAEPDRRITQVCEHRVTHQRIQYRHQQPAMDYSRYVSMLRFDLQRDLRMSRLHHFRVKTKVLG
jgi:hypothetical protein